jgi:hypothetical protein
MIPSFYVCPCYCCLHGPDFYMTMCMLMLDALVVVNIVGVS